MHMKKVLILFLLFSTVIMEQSIAQSDTLENELPKKVSVTGYPVMFYLPETRWGAGGACLVTFRLSGESNETRPSSFNGGVAYTQNKQLLFFFPYNLYKNNNALKVIGELGYYTYFYNHYGIGNESDQEDREIYDVKYPRIHTSVLQRFGDFYVGVKTRYDNYNITELKEGGLLANDKWATQGGGQIFTFGPLIQYDTKDYQFHPSKGWLSEVGLITSKEGVLSDATFTKFHLDARHYGSFKKDHIIASNVYLGHIWGDVPFSELFYYGSNKRARGLSDRRFKDRSFLAIQSEYRFPIWSWLGGVAFASTSAVGEGTNDLLSNRFRWTGGGGLRLTLNKEDRVRLRFDYAFSEEGTNFYLTANNAF